MASDDSGSDTISESYAEWLVWSGLSSRMPKKARSVRARTLPNLLNAVTKAQETALKLQADFALMDFVIGDLERVKRSIELSMKVSKLVGRSPERSRFWRHLVALLRSPPKGTKPFTDNDLQALIVASNSDWANPPCRELALEILAKDDDEAFGVRGGAVLAENRMRVERQRRGLAAKKGARVGS